MTADLLLKAERQVEKVQERIKGTLFEQEFKEDIEIALYNLHSLYNNLNENQIMLFNILLNNDLIYPIEEKDFESIEGSIITHFCTIKDGVYKTNNGKIIKDSNRTHIITTKNYNGRIFDGIIENTINELLPIKLPYKPEKLYAIIDGVYDEDLKDTYWNIAYILNVTTNDIITPKKYFKNNTSIEFKDYIKAINKFGNKTK